MALSLGLERAGSPPLAIHTAASVKLDRDGDGFAITTIELTTMADVPGLDADKFTAIGSIMFRATRRAPE